MTWRPASQNARVSGSISPGPGSRPRRRIQYASIHAVAALNSVPIAAPTCGVMSGDCASMMWWPSDSHNATASSSAATQSGWPGEPSAVRAV